MRIEEFDYDLPEELIAQHPAKQRDAARMLRLERASGVFADGSVRDLPGLLRPGDLLVVNNTRVLPARLFGYRQGLRANPLPGRRNPARHEFLRTRVEVLLTRQLSADTWEALVRPGRKLPVGERIVFVEPPVDTDTNATAPAATATAPPPRSDVEAQRAARQAAPLLEGEIVGRGEFGERQLRLRWQGNFNTVLERLGHIPLPPYIHRPRGGADAVEDRERYQTVYATRPGSVAAPTAGLHFTAELFAALEQRGVERAEITLEVGLGTFQPLHVANIEKHRMHAERFEISEGAAARIGAARRAGRRIIAVGTTSVRALESSAAEHAGEVRAGRSETRLFLYPGITFQVIGGLLTNFHLPRSTLLMLVCAFAGRENVLRAYAHAVEARYRFFSYGDCMLIV